MCISFLSLCLPQKESSQHEVFAPICLTSQPGERFCDSVQVHGLPDVFEREYVLQKIKGKTVVGICNMYSIVGTVYFQYHLHVAQQPIVLA